MSESAYDSNCAKCNNCCSGCPPQADFHPQPNIYHELMMLPPEFKCPKFMPKLTVEQSTERHKAYRREIWDAIIAFRED